MPPILSLQSCTTPEEFTALRTFVHTQHVEASSFSDASRIAQQEDCDSGADFPDLHTFEAFEALSLQSYLALDEDGSIKGACGLKRGESEGYAHVSYLFVDSTVRGQGVGTKLLRRILESAQGLGALHTLKLLTLEGQYATAIKLYTTFGFRVVERVEPGVHPLACPNYTLLFMESKAPFLLTLSPVFVRGPSAAPTPSSRGGILILHGYGQNGQDLYSRYKPLLARKLKDKRLCIPTAPHTVPFALSGVDALRATQACWWYSRGGGEEGGELRVFEDENQSYEGWGSVSLPAIVALWEREGPFEGILGFSQGAVAVHQLLLGKALHPPPKWVVVASGFPSRAMKQEGRALATPSLHLVCETDATVPYKWQAELIDRFDSPIVVKHETGHSLPQKSAELAAILSFIDTHSA